MIIGAETLKDIQNLAVFFSFLFVLLLDLGHFCRLFSHVGVDIIHDPFDAVRTVFSLAVKGFNAKLQRVEFSVPDVILVTDTILYSCTYN